MIPSSRATDARPVRRCFSSPFRASSALCIRRSVSFLISAIVADMSGLSLRRLAVPAVHHAADVLAEDDAADVPGDEQVEDTNRHTVLAAQRDGGGVHDGQAFFEDFLVRHGLEQRSRWIF